MVVAWTIELDGAGRRLLALSHHATRHQVDLLQSALQGSGDRVRAGSFGEMGCAAELHRRISALEASIEA
jgi:hypothetical protein